MFKKYNLCSALYNRCLKHKLVDQKGWKKIKQIKTNIAGEAILRQKSIIWNKEDCNLMTEE